MTNDLDTLLAAPLPDTPDNGFTAGVEARVAAEARRAARRESYLIGAGMAVALISIPFTPAGAALGAFMENMGGALLQSQTLAVGLAGLVLGYIALQFARD